ncbi:sigma-70 family RNA polymerase sigma factor [Paracoccus sulfuroxidans]|uniref:RNA polymerase sigma factor (Sigma-70 family) n=1 Tax=Paracoccus sulfuroxidans TaxID=384678 RepID=A0A562P181_9RHOB|nr:sigma-70 family RNA polymerase sigma factor [Paracoccus sulfuroxidans]TWI38237.1 RNA polymerase sigma factor (sigma-70 family) [Paracoccus sulfuroxidans]
MKDKSISDLAKEYQETNSQRIFLEIQKRLKPMISRLSGSDRNLMEKEDMEQAGAIAIATALTSYDIEKGGFDAYVMSFVIAEIRQEKSLSVLVSQSHDKKFRFIQNRATKYIESEVAAGIDRGKAKSEFARIYGVTVKDIDFAISSRTSAAEYIEGHHSYDHETDITDHFIHCEIKNVVWDAIDELDEKKRAVITHRHMLDDPSSVYEAGAAAGITYKNVSRTSKHAINEMKESLARKGLTSSDFFGV